MYQRTAKGKNSVGLAVFALSLLLAQARDYLLIQYFTSKRGHWNSKNLNSTVTKHLA